MNNVNGIIAVASPASVLPGALIEERIATDEELKPADLVTVNKRFGLVDLWKVHSGKRYANVFLLPA